MSEALAATGKSVNQVFEDQQIQEDLQKKDNYIKEMEHRVTVIMKSKEADLKKYRANTARLY